MIIVKIIVIPFNQTKISIIISIVFCVHIIEQLFNFDFTVWLFGKTSN